MKRLLFLIGVMAALFGACCGRTGDAGSGPATTVGQADSARLGMDAQLVVDTPGLRRAGADSLPEPAIQAYHTQEDRHLDSLKQLKEKKLGGKHK